MRDNVPSQPADTAFSPTRWTLVAAAAASNGTQAREALGALFGSYWAPLYRYLRRLGEKPQDAEDLVQGFFASLLEGNGLHLANPDRGRFRAFLLGGLKHFRANEWQARHRLKRGGFAPHLSLDVRLVESCLDGTSDAATSPDTLFDRDWAETLLARVLAALEAEDRTGDFSRWKPFLALASDRIPYAEAAASLGTTDGAARVAVHRLRKRYRQRLRDEVARTLLDESQVDEEMRSLFAALSC